MSDQTTPKTEPGKVRTVRYPLWLKLTLVTTVLAVLPAAILGLTLLNLKLGELRDSVKVSHKDMTAKISIRIETLVAQGGTGLVAITQSLEREDLDEQSKLTLIKSHLESRDELDHVWIYDAKGGYIDAIRQPDAPKMTAPKTLDKTLMTQAKETNAVSIGDASSLGEGFSRLLMVAPIQLDDGQTTGYVAGNLSLEKVQAQVELETDQDPRLVHHPESLFVVDQERAVVAHPDRAFVMKSKSNHHLLPAFEKNKRIEAFADFSDEEGLEMVGSATQIEKLPWIVVVQVPSEIAYQELVEARNIIIWVLLATVLIAVLVALLFVQSLARPIRRLVAYARELAQRRFDTRIDIGTKDELGLLGDVMSNSAAQLKASEKQLVEEAAIRSDLGRYLPKEIVERVVKREQDMGLGGERKEITVLFADVVEFTPMTEQLGAEEVVALLNQLFTILTEIVFRHGGTVDKFIGDCVMAFWGAPGDQEDHAERALAAAEDMMRFLEVGNAGWQERYGITVELAIGVNSGEAIVGNVGSKTRMEYTSIGEVVNTAARLEAIARPGQILITEATRIKAGDLFDFIDFGARQLAGRKSEETSVFEVSV